MSAVCDICGRDCGGGRTERNSKIALAVHRAMAHKIKGKKHDRTVDPNVNPRIIIELGEYFEAVGDADYFGAMKP